MVGLLRDLYMLYKVIWIFFIDNLGDIEISKEGGWNVRFVFWKELFMKNGLEVDIRKYCY